MINQLSIRSRLHLDWPLVAGIGLIFFLGLFVLYSAKQEIALIERQILRFGIAFLLMLTIAQFPPRFFRMLAPALYIGGFILLLLVLVAGYISKGGQRWLDLWIVRFQPAEIMKLAVPLMTARILEDKILPLKFKSLFLPSLLILLPVVLVAKQPDLGTAILIFASGFWTLFFTGISFRVFLTLGGVVTAMLPVLWFWMRDYQRERVLTFLDPERDPLGTSYQIIQSKIAIGSGGLYGKGWLNGSQSQLEFLPERATDCIFAVFGEEFGLVGCLILLMLYFHIIIRGLYISVQAQDTFTRLLTSSLIMTVFIYVGTNMGMVLGLLPVVGIPLPLVSYGGTSLVTLMASFGIIMSIHTHRLIAK